MLVLWCRCMLRGSNLLSRLGLHRFERVGKQLWLVRFCMPNGFSLQQRRLPLCH